MTRKSEHSAAAFDVAGLAHRYLDGELSPADRSALTAALRNQDEVRTEFVRCLLHQVRLEEVLARRRSEAALNAIDSPPSGKVEPGAALPADRPVDDGRPANPVLGFIGKLFTSGGGNPSVPALFALALTCVLFGAGLATWFANRNQAIAPRGEIAVSPPLFQPNLPGGTAYSASLVSMTNCRWANARGPVDIDGGKLRPGQSLHLLEGVARIKSTLASGGVGDFQLEGPLAMMLTNEGMPSLLYGKLTGDFTCDFDRFTLDTPLGRIIVSGNASIGVTAAANDVELHVFSGVATYEMWAIGLGGAPEPLKATTGSSVRARVAADGSISVDRGQSRENRFVTPAAIAASQLSISDEYVSTIRAAKPIAYWRFETETDGLVRNEMADRIHCRMVGDAVRLHPGQNNTTAEFGVTAGPGYLVSEDSLDGLIDDSYTIEAWLKPSYYHHATMFSLLRWAPGDSPFQSHQLAVELCGPISGFWNDLRPTDPHPGRLRFMHRTSECFSSSPYVVRKWQHFAAVKDRDAMRLYADGQLAAEAHDERNFEPGLRILMGQLYPRTPHIRDDVTSRLFVGELDEVALYNYALHQTDMQKHIHLTRPASESPSSASGPDY